jgi:O-antigen/teichoic acid export membrane protein
MRPGTESGVAPEPPPAPPPAHVDPVPLGSRVARNLAVLTAGRGIGVALQFAAFAVIASYLGPGLFGVYSFAVAVVAIFRLLPTFGFEQIVPRDVAQRPELEPSLVPNVLYIRVLLALGAYGLLALAVVLLGYSELSRDAALVAGLALVLVSGETMRASLATRLRLGWSAAADILESALVLAGAVTLVLGGAGLMPFLVLAVVAKTANVGLVMVGATVLTDYGWRPLPRTWFPTLRQAAPLALAALVIALYYRLDIVVLARIAPSADVGQYGMALRFLDAVVLLTAVLMSVLQPLLARAVVEGPDELRRRYGQAVHLTTVLAVLVGVAGAMAAARLVPSLPGLHEYEGAGVALALLAPAGALILVATVIQGTLLAARRERTVLAISVAGLATNVLLLAVLIPAFSYKGAAAATSLTELVLIVLCLRAVRALDVRWPFERVVPLAAATAALAATLAVGLLVHPLLQVGAGLAVYAVCVTVFGAVDRRELRDALRRTQ